MSLKYAIALTGGIGSGKSTVASLLKLYGYCVICADTIAHRVLEELKQEVVQTFGATILDSNGEINRQKLGAIVFEDCAKREKLEAILHPKIKQEILEEAKIQEKKEVPYFVDIPLFFEKNCYPIAHSLVVFATKDLQIARLKKRNGMSESGALKRICAQMPLAEKCKKADFVLENTGTLEELQEELESYLKHNMPKL